MKKSVAFLFLTLAISGLSLSAGEAKKPVFALKTILEGKSIFKVGDKISFKAQCEYPETYLVCGWNVFAYLNNIPKDFCGVLKLKPKIAKDPKWSSVSVGEWKWFPQAKRGEKEMVCSISTADWPAGDYQISISAIFMKKDKSSTLPNIYRQSSLVFTLEK